MFPCRSLLQKYKLIMLSEPLAPGGVQPLPCKGRAWLGSHQPLPNTHPGAVPCSRTMLGTIPTISGTTPTMLGTIYTILGTNPTMLGTTPTMLHTPAGQLKRR